MGSMLLSGWRSWMLSDFMSQTLGEGGGGSWQSRVGFHVEVEEYD